MTERNLADLPGCLPLGAVGSLERYLDEKSTTFGADSPIYAAGVAASAGMLIDPEEISRLAARERDRLIREHRGVPYVGALTSRLAAVQHEQGVKAGPVRETALTSLFRDEYGVDLAPYQANTTGMFGISGMIMRGDANAAVLNYSAIGERYDNVFWQLALEGDYGFVNMLCPYFGSDRIPLIGSGNITHMRGVQAALEADVALIERQAK